MTLYSYCIPFDDGAAPNPFWGTCTLAICKPVIRRLAKKGDWIVGTGSKKFGLQNQIVYAMEVSDVLSFQQYDDLCKRDKTLKKKIPDTTSNDFRRHVGDCIYDFSVKPFLQRDGPHTLSNIKTDMGGKRVLLSTNFYYFGRAPIKLPENLLPIVRQGQGHKSKSNDKYKDAFLEWIVSNKAAQNKVYRKPYSFDEWQLDGCVTRCSRRHLQSDRKDELLGKCE
jgi:hypothetical protein